MVNAIFLKLTYTKYLRPKDASSEYHNLKLNKKSSYLTTFASQFGRYRHARLLFRVVPSGGMFKRKMHEMFKEVPLYLT